MSEPSSIVSELTRQLYAGVIETPPWQSFLQALGRETASRITSIMLSPPGSPAVNLLSSAGEPEVDYAFRDQLCAMDPFVSLAEGLVTTLHDFLGAGELERNDYYNRFMRARWGTGFVLGADVRTARGYTARLRLGRGVDADDFGIETHRLVETLLPHLRQAVEIFDRLHGLEVETTELNDALDRLGVARFLLDAEQRVTQPNRRAEALFAGGDGLAVRNARLAIADEKGRQQLASFLVRARDATDAQNGARPCLPDVIVIPGRRGAAPLAVAVRVLRSPVDLRADHAPLVAVYVSTPEQSSAMPADVIRLLLGVTPAEADLAARLVHGATIDEAATELGVTRATARTQLYSIFRKTGLRRQSELVALVAQTAARLPHQ